MRHSAWKRCLTLLSAATFLLASCSGAASPSPTTVSPSPTSPPSSVAPAASPSAPNAAAARAAVCEAAKTEGKLVHWNNFASPEAIFSEFNKAYPGIVVESLTNRPDASMQALLTELTIGRQPTADIISGELVTLKPVVDFGGHDATIKWETLGVPADLVAPTGNAVRYQRVTIGLAFNSTTVKADELPNTWGGLLNQKWSGQIVLDARGQPWSHLSLLWGHDPTISFVKQLLALKPLIITGGTAGLLAVAGGQAKMTTHGRSEAVAEQKAKGTPVEIKYLDVVPVFDSSFLVPKGAPHPNAAACMVAWLVTDGAEAFAKAEFKSNASRPSGLPDGAPVLLIDTADKADAVQKVSQEIGKLYTGTGS